MLEFIKKTKNFFKVFFIVLALLLIIKFLSEFLQINDTLLCLSKNLILLFFFIYLGIYMFLIFTELKKQHKYSLVVSVVINFIRFGFIIPIGLVALIKIINQLFIC